MQITPSGILIAILWSGFTLLCIRAFWSNPSGARGDRYFILGRLSGIVFNVCFALTMPTIAPFPGLQYWQEVVFLWVIGFPITIIAGYCYGRIFQRVVEWKSKK
jgi:hypothetical protein